MFNNFFRVIYEIMRKNTVQPRMSQMAT